MISFLIFSGEAGGGRKSKRILSVESDLGLYLTTLRL